MARLMFVGVLACLCVPVLAMDEPSFAELEASLKQRITRNAQDASAWRMLGQLRLQQGDWDGALQAVYSNQYASEGIMLVGVYTAVNVLAAGLPGIGAALRERVRALGSCGVMGGLIHDEGGGRVRAGPGREPLLTYEMAPRDLARVRRSMTILSELSFAAGAREVYAPVFGAAPIRSMDDARKLEAMRLDARRIECLAFHPLGSARVANDARRGVVDQRGECFALPGLFVADGSVLPTSIGVNSQVAIMAMATRIAWGIRERFGNVAKPAQAQVAWG